VRESPRRAKARFPPFDKGGQFYPLRGFSLLFTLEKKMFREINSAFQSLFPPAIGAFFASYFRKEDVPEVYSAFQSLFPPAIGASFASYFRKEEGAGRFIPPFNHYFHPLLELPLLPTLEKKKVPGGLFRLPIIIFHPLVEFSLPSFFYKRKKVLQ